MMKEKGELAFCDTTEIFGRLHSLFDGEQWRVDRCYVRRRPDRQSFVNANIIAILEEAGVDDQTTQADLESAKRSLGSYLSGHQGFHWPLDENGRSRITNSSLLRKIDYFSLDADADCTCLVRLALGDWENVAKIAEDLAYYRLEGRRFQLPYLQKDIPGADGSFLTWFPAKNQCVNGKKESIDLTVDANILWFLGKFNQLDIPGAQETIRFVKTMLDSDLIVGRPAAISPYYPYPLVILYSIARAISWGKIENLESHKGRLMQLAEMVGLRSQLDVLLFANIAGLLGKAELAREKLTGVGFTPMLASSFYVCPPFFAIANMAGPIMRGAAAWPWLRIGFASEALQWAMLLWVTRRI